LAQNIEDPPQRFSVEILANANALAVTEIDQAASLSRWHRRWGLNRSHTGRRAAT
jgi:hypothetical protein